MTNAKTFVLALVAVVIAISAYLFPQTQAPLGAAGPDFQAHTFFNEGSTNGGLIATTSTATTYTTAVRDFNNTPSVVNWLPNKNITISVSGTSTQAYVPQVGDTANVFFRNASTTEAATVTFAAVDTGVDIQRAEATGGDLILNGKDYAKLTFIRTSRNLVTVIFDEMIEGD